MTDDRSYGEYRTLETLGQGGMGVVYRAEHRGTGQLVALKVARELSEGVIDTVRREIRALEGAKHAGIAGIVARGERDGLPWYAMELLDGVSLQEEIGRWFPNKAAVAGTATLSQAPGQWASSLLAGLQLGRPTVGSSGGNAVSDAGPASPTKQGKAPYTREKRAEAAGGSLEQAVRLALALCEPLAFLHGEGIVHCDLKPDNIMLRDGRPVLVDFGLNARFWGHRSREILDLQAMATGTIAFMSPEQIRGALVDPRADLYALGCVIYVMLTGEPPFMATTISALARKHLETVPTPPSTMVDGVPHALDMLVLDLLAKDPTQRVGYADDVAARLAALLPPSPAQADASATAPTRPYVYRPRYVGRSDLAELIDERVTDVNHQQGAVLWLLGAQGSGKTRVVSEAAQRARNRGVAVYGGACSPQTAAGAGAGVPQDGSYETRGTTEDASDLDVGAIGSSQTTIAPQVALKVFRGPLRAAIDLAAEGGARITRRLFGPQASVLAQIEPRVLELEGIKNAPAVTLSPELERDRLFTSLTWTLGALAVQRPMMVIIDDVHWADELSLRFLEYLLRSEALAVLPALFLCTSPPTAIEVAGIVEGAETLTMSPLATDDIRDMVADMLAVADVPEALVDHLAMRARGMPYVVTEMMRTAVSSHLLRRRRPAFDAGDTAPIGRAYWVLADGTALADASFEDLELPETLASLLQHRLDGLDAVTQVLAGAVALLGPRCPRDNLDKYVARAVADGDPEFAGAVTDSDVADGVDRLLVAHVLKSGTDGELTFVHLDLWSSCYSGLSEETRRRGHERAARMLSAAKVTDAHAAVIGHHWLRAEQPDLARPYFLTAARAARNSYALATAEERYRTWLSLIPLTRPSRARVDGIFEFVEILEVVGRWDEALTLLREGLEAAKATGDKALEGDCHQRLGTLLNLRGQHDEAIVHLGVARRIFSRLGKIAQLGATLGEIGRILRRRGELDSAATHFERQMTVATSNGNAGQQIQAHMNLGRLAVHRRQTTVALEHFTAGHNLSIVHRRRRSGCRLLGDLGDAHLLRGDYGAAIASYESQLSAATTIGDRQSASSAIRQIGVAHWRHGSPASALRCFSTSLNVAIELGDQTAAAVTLARVADVLAARGDHDLADRSYEVAIEMMRRGALHYYMSSALYRRAEVLVRILGESTAEGRPGTQRSDSVEDDDGGNLRAAVDVDAVYSLLGEAATVAKRVRRSRVALAASTLVRVLDARTGDISVAAVAADFEAQLDKSKHPLDRAALLYTLWRVDPTEERRGAAANAYLDPASRISATARLRYAEIQGQKLGGLESSLGSGDAATLPPLPRAVGAAPSLSDIAGQVWTVQDWMGTAP